MAAGSGPRDPGEAAPLGDGALLLDNQLCFLVYRLHRALTDRYRPVLAELGLTYPQYLVMLVLWESQPMSVGHLWARLHLDSGTLSPVLKRLEAAGLVTRSRTPEDERVVTVALTAAGRDLRERARDVPACVGRALASTPEGYREIRGALTEWLSRVE